MPDELRDEYEFEFGKSLPNRFGVKLPSGSRIVVLEPEVASAFPDSASVNAFLKAVIGAWPATKGPAQGVEQLDEKSVAG